MSAKWLFRLLTITYIVSLLGDKRETITKRKYLSYLDNISSSILFLLTRLDSYYTRVSCNDFTICLQHNVNRWLDKQPDTQKKIEREKWLYLFHFIDR
jgi:hypothetical protein